MNEAINTLELKGKELANAEKEYKKAFTREYYVLKSLKEPASIILKIIYGQPEVAELREKRDIAEVEYKVAQEKLFALKNQKFINSKQNIDKEKSQHYEIIAEQHKNDKVDILEDFDNFDNLDIDFDYQEPKKVIPQIIQDFYDYQEKNKKS